MASNIKAISRMGSDTALALYTGPDHPNHRKDIWRLIIGEEIWLTVHASTVHNITIGQAQYNAMCQLVMVHWSAGKALLQANADYLCECGVTVPFMMHALCGSIQHQSKFCTK